MLETSLNVYDIMTLQCTGKFTFLVSDVKISNRNVTFLCVITALYEIVDGENNIAKI